MPPRLLPHDALRAANNNLLMVHTISGEPIIPELKPSRSYCYADLDDEPSSIWNDEVRYVTIPFKMF
jgi:hypothetical protein